MKTLVILTHPNIESAKVNKRWKQELQKYPNKITLHELYPLYPDGHIAVETEQALLEAHSHIVLQFPIYWYSTPPLLKSWLDAVFTFGWAYGDGGNKLKGKKIGLAVSAGDKKANYTTGGSVDFTLAQLLAPLKATCNYIGAQALPLFALYEASSPTNDKEVEQSAKEYTEYIFRNQSTL